MNRLEERMFPKLPSCMGSWSAIYLEPVINCGERVTIAVAAVTSTGEAKVVQAIRSEVLECLYGSKSDDLQSQIDWVIESLSIHLKSNRPTSTWQPPMSGVYFSESRKAASQDIQGILKQAARFSSSLNDFALGADRRDDGKRNKDEFFKKIKTAVIAHAPDLKGYFDVKIAVSSKESVMTRFGFLNDRYAANFNAVSVTNVANSINAAKSKIFDLESLRDSDSLLLPIEYELIVGLPQRADVTISESVRENIDDRTEALIEIADRVEIRVKPIDQISEAAARVIQKASGQN